MDDLEPYDGILVGFSGDPIQMCGFLEARTKFGEERSVKTITIRYMVVNSLYSYNILLGRPAINKLRAIVSSIHLKMKYPTKEGGVGENMGAFAWSVGGMSGIDLDFMCHCLAVDSKAKPIVQRRRKLGEEKRLIVVQELERLRSSGHVILVGECGIGVKK